MFLVFVVLLLDSIDLLWCIFNWLFKLIFFLQLCCWYIGEFRIIDNLISKEKINCSVSKNENYWFSMNHITRVIVIYYMYLQELSRMKIIIALSNKTKLLLILYELKKNYKLRTKYLLENWGKKNNFVGCFLNYCQD